MSPLSQAQFLTAPGSSTRDDNYECSCEHIAKVSVATAPVTTAYHIETSFVTSNVSFNKIHEITATKRYSSGVFLDGKRCIKNCIGFGNVVIYDIDNDGENILSLIDAHKLTQEYKSVIVTTKSHQKEKHGIKADRYRFTILLDGVISVNVEEYKSYYIHIASLLGIEEYIDTLCKDAARMYQPHPQQEVYYSEGTNILSEKQLRISFEEKKYLDSTTRASTSFSNHSSNNYCFDDAAASGSKTDYIRSIMGSPLLLKMLHFDERFVKGSRNNYLYSIGCYLLDVKLTVGEIKQTLLWMNSLRSGLSETEIKNTIFRSLKL
ncbi:MAG: hypothetical protein DRG78_09285 [Epsilonproteobacteria bacterium]|nr:MAG: hypothetical protein DRG78_09285 [Campylobacterota bacterium]